MTRAEKQRLASKARRDNLRDKGLVKKEVWIKPENTEKLRKLEIKLRS